MKVRDNQKFRIRSLGYDPEIDELDLLINSERPVAAESIPLDEGIYLRRDLDSGQVVGAFIRGYYLFLKKVQQQKVISLKKAKALGLDEEARAIIAWQRELLGLSKKLKTELGDPRRQHELLHALLST